MPTRGLSRVSWPAPGRSIATGGVTLFGPPWAPWNVGGVPVDSGVGVYWDYPYRDGNSPITQYLILPYIGSTPQSMIVTGPSTSYWVTGLTNGTAYTFSVAAINAIGQSPWSAISAPITPVAAGSIWWDPSAMFGAAGWGMGMFATGIPSGPVGPALQTDNFNRPDAGVSVGQPGWQIMQW